MLLHSLFGKTVRDLRWSTFWVGLSLFLLAFYFTLAFPAYTKALDLNSLLAKLPPAMKALIGGSLIDVSTVNGFLNVELFPLILPAVLGGYAMAQGSAATAGEESRGTIDVLLSYPISRVSLVVQKTAAVGASLVVIAAALWAGALIGAAASSSPIDGAKLAAGLVLSTLLAFDFGALALLIAGWSGNRSAAIGIPVAILVVMYLMNALAPIIDALESVKGLSLFHWYLGHDPLRQGLDLGDAAVLALVAVGLFAAALAAFDRRNLAA